MEKIQVESLIQLIRLWKRYNPNVIKLRDDEPSGYYCLDGIFI